MQPGQKETTCPRPMSMSADATDYGDCREGDGCIGRENQNLKSLQFILSEYCPIFPFSCSAKIAETHHLFLEFYFSCRIASGNNEHYRSGVSLWSAVQSFPNTGDVGSSGDGDSIQQ